MLFRKKPKPQQRYGLPAGRRIYAIGDIHGRFDLLEEMLALIASDDGTRAATETSIIFLGDLIDRGPQSSEVVHLVRALCQGGAAILVKGNHEELFVNAARGDRNAARAFLSVGGDATLRSYGIADDTIHAGSFADLAVLMTRRIPREDIDFLDSGTSCIQIGDYLFAHAGIEPGVDLADQQDHEMRWIRERFTRSERDHGVRVIHGHSLSENVEVCRNRIGIDTGAYASGRLSALGMEGEDIWFLEANGSATRDFARTANPRADNLRASGLSDSSAR